MSELLIPAKQQEVLEAAGNHACPFGDDEDEAVRRTQLFGDRCPDGLPLRAVIPYLFVPKWQRIPGQVHYIGRHIRPAQQPLDVHRYLDALRGCPVTSTDD